MKKIILMLALAASLTGCVGYAPNGQPYVDPVGTAVVSGVAGAAIGYSLAPRYYAPAPVYVYPSPYYGPRYRGSGFYYRQPRY